MFFLRLGIKTAINIRKYMGMMVISPSTGASFPLLNAQESEIR